MGRLDYTDLDRRLMQPLLPRLRHALRLVSAIEAPEAAWALLLAKGLLPAQWRTPGARVFRAYSDEPHGVIPATAWVDGLADLPHPCLARMAALVAAASAAMDAVEAQAALVASALEPWGLPRPRAVIWHVLPPRKLKQHQIRGTDGICSTMALAALHAEHAVAEAGQAKWSVAEGLSARPGRTAPQHVFARDVAMHEAWRNAVESRARVARGPLWRALGPSGRGALPQRTPMALVGRAFAELPDPMTPLLAIWDAGCVLDAITEEGVLLHLPGELKIST